MKITVKKIDDTWFRAGAFDFHRDLSNEWWVVSRNVPHDEGQGPYESLSEAIFDHYGREYAIHFVSSACKDLTRQ